ncbi:virulence factor MVIN family protein [Stanieria cyanosphaera PCC 7437]|uniref:Virulence factor MVIN family protein n=1 Tax=Stanieria cyanosphaera (strain ATCC 29371 / PCC 7437) TaxID=111780 RepID=K9Y119_STAC7|nr:lipid II flippase MurJ [Stanieria cyanosphaera]AFZ37637.1 virulence factor MVIN family protein [Stanieria cyanosphaera PCC 7437]
MKIELRSQKIFDLWSKLTRGSINKKIFGAALTVGILTALVKFISVGKELVVAWKFGTGDQLDAFLIALVVPSFVINVVAGSFQSSLIPVYIKAREQEGRITTQKLLSNIFIVATIFLIAIAIATVLMTPLYLPLLASGFSTEKLVLTERLIWVISPLILLSGIVSIWGGVLNAGERFALAAFSPATTPIATIILLFVFPDWGIFALAIGLLLGSLVEIAILGIGLRRQKVEIIPRWTGFDGNLTEVSRQYLPVVTGAFLMCSANLVDQSMAAMLPAGSVSALGYANRVIALPLTLITLALGTAVIPYFSKTIAQKNWTQVERTFRLYLKLIFVSTIPLTIAFIIASKLIVQLLFERGSFTAEDTNIVYPIQICYALQIPFYIAAIFVVRLINSLGINYFLAWGSAINLIFNIVGNYVLMAWLGVKGIALSTSLVYLISFIFLYVVTNKHLNKICLQNE